MRQTRVIVLAAGMVMALAPMVASAQVATTGQTANEAVIAQNQAAKQMGYVQSQVLNYLAQCQILASGGNPPGAQNDCPPQSNNPYALVTGTASTTSGSSSSSSGSSGTSGMVNPGTSPGSCVAAQRPLTHAEQELVNAWAIAKDNAGGTLAEPPEVVALIGCL